MAKHFKPTGRRTFKKRFGKKLGGNKRVAAQSWATTTYVARSLYPPIPSQMKLALRLHQYANYQVDINGQLIVGISGISPVGLGGAFAEGFAAMMRLYSHAVVDRIQVVFGVIPTDDNNPAANHQRPFPVTSLVIPWNDFNGAAALVPDEVMSYPEAKTKLVGSLQAERETTFYHSVDVRKALANPHEEHYACRSTLAGVIAVPALNANIGSSPMICLFASNNDPANNRFLIIRREVTYHMTFSMRHATSTGAAP